MRVPLLADVQHIFGKHALKQYLKTRDKAVAITRAACLTADFKDPIIAAHAIPAALLEDELENACDHLTSSMNETNAITGVFEKGFAELLQAR